MAPDFKSGILAKGIRFDSVRTPPKTIAASAAPQDAKAGRHRTVSTSAMRSDHSALRTSLLPALLDVKLRNQDEADRRTVRFFEIGPVYLPQADDELPVEQLCLSVLDDGVPGVQETNPPTHVEGIRQPPVPQK